MTSAEEFVAQADALLDQDLSEAHVDVRSLAETYRRRQGDRRAHAFARALVKRARSAGVAIDRKVTVDDLKAEIKRRNEGRDAGDRIKLSGTKDELEAALKADDER
jgi:hypothetical protein